MYNQLNNKLFLVIFLFILIKIDGVLASQNIVKNGSFERLEDGKLTDWSEEFYIKDKNVTDYKVVNSLSKEGGNSLKAENFSPNHAKLLQEVEVEASAKYKISGYIKAQGVEKQNEEGGFSKGANISLGNVLEQTTPVYGDTDWIYVEMYAIIGAENTKINLMVGIGGYSSLVKGTAYFDDIKVEKVAEIPSDASVANFAKDQNDEQEVKTINEEIANKEGYITSALTYFVIFAAVLIVLGFLFAKKACHSNEPKNNSQINKEDKENLSLSENVNHDEHKEINRLFDDDNDGGFEDFPDEDK